MSHLVMLSSQQNCCFLFNKKEICFNNIGHVVVFSERNSKSHHILRKLFLCFRIKLNVINFIFISHYFPQLLRYVRSNFLRQFSLFNLIFNPPRYLFKHHKLLSLYCLRPLKINQFLNQYRNDRNHRPISSAKRPNSRNKNFNRYLVKSVRNLTGCLKIYGIFLLRSYL